LLISKTAIKIDSLVNPV